MGRLVHGYLPCIVRMLYFSGQGRGSAAAAAAASTEEPPWGMKGPHCVPTPEPLPTSSSGVSVADCEHAGGRVTLICLLYCRQSVKGGCLQMKR